MHTMQQLAALSTQWSSQKASFSLGWEVHSALLKHLRAFQQCPDWWNSASPIRLSPCPSAAYRRVRSAVLLCPDRISVTGSDWLPDGLAGATTGSETLAMEVAQTRHLFSFIKGASDHFTWIRIKPIVALFSLSEDWAQGHWSKLVTILGHCSFLDCFSTKESVITWCFKCTANAWYLLEHKDEPVSAKQPSIHFSDLTRMCRIKLL